jgi:DNA-binding LytR/AlgR family response regulator
MIKILVVEDDMIIAAKISLQLSNLGYEVTGIEPRGEDAIRHFAEELPDLVLLDINLKGKLDGIQTAHEMQKNGPVPIIYLTANADEATFERAKVTRPQAFISKPFNQLDLQRAIELTISRLAEAQQSELPKEEQAPDAPFILDDRIFVRHKEKMVKLMISDILSVEAERNYCRIFTRQKEYLLSITLKMIEERLPNRSFLRVHRSHLINLAHVDEVGENHVMMGQHLVPVSDSFRDQLLKRIQTF